MVTDNDILTIVRPFEDAKHRETEKDVGSTRDAIFSPTQGVKPLSPLDAPLGDSRGNRGHWRDSLLWCWFALNVRPVGFAEIVGFS